MLSEKLGRSPIDATFSMESDKQRIDMGVFMASPMKAAIYLRPDFQKNSEIYKNTSFENFWSVFNITEKLVKEDSGEILNVRRLEHLFITAVKTTPQKTRFAMWKICKNLGYRLSWRWQDTIGLQHPERQNFALDIAYAWWNAVDKWNHLVGRWGVRHQWQREKQDPEKQHEAQHEHVSVRVVLQSS